MPLTISPQKKSGLSFACLGTTHHIDGEACCSAENNRTVAQFVTVQCLSADHAMRCAAPAWRGGGYSGVCIPSTSAGLLFDRRTLRSGFRTGSVSVGHACTYSNVIPRELVICDKSISLTCGSNGGVWGERCLWRRRL